jgi:hypothetical protein
MANIDFNRISYILALFGYDIFIKYLVVRV